MTAGNIGTDIDEQTYKLKHTYNTWLINIKNNDSKQQKTYM